MSRTPMLSHDEAIAAVEQATDELFYRRGIVGVSVAEIRDTSGVSLRRLYDLCPSKTDLVSLWLRHRHQVWLDDFTAAVATRLADGTDPVDAIFDALTDWMTATSFRGCGFINTHAECSELIEEHQEIIRGHKRAVADYLSSIVSDGEAMAVLLDGAIVQAAMFADPAPIEHARRAATALRQSSR